MSDGLGRTGEGELTHGEGTIETADLVEGGAGGPRLVLEIVDAVAYEKDSDTPTVYSGGLSRSKTPGQFKASYFQGQRPYRAVRDQANKDFEVDNITDLSLFQGARVKYNIQPRKTSDFNDHIITKFTPGTTVKVEPADESAVIESLRGKTPAEAAALAATPGIKGTKWAAVVVNKRAVEKLGLTIDATGRYA